MKNKILIALVSLAISSLAQAAVSAATPTPSAAPVGSVTVEMKNGKGESVGTAWISSAKAGDKGVIIQLDLHGLPEGTHGIHLHEKGSCVGPDFKSAGGHFSPQPHDHGTLAKNGPHAGDLGNIQVPASGKLQTKLQDSQADLGVSMRSLQQAAGTALVIHAKADDNKSQPAGNSGDRVACGEIHAVSK